MSRSRERLSKHFLRLREGDFDYLDTVYPATGPSPVIRQLVAAHVDHLKREATEAVPDALPSLEISELQDDG